MKIRREIKALGLAMGTVLLLLLVLWIVDFFTSYQSDTVTLEDGTKITTYRTRFTGKPKEQWIRYPWPGDYEYVVGDLTESSKRHGKWTFMKRHCTTNDPNREIS